MDKKNVFIYACDGASGNRMSNHLQSLSLNFKIEIYVYCSEPDLLNAIQNCHRPLIICDKLKLGFKYTCVFNRITTANRTSVILVWSKDCNQKYLGYRLKRNNIAGYIEYTDKIEPFRKALHSFLNTEFYYPDFILEGLKMGDDKNNYNYIVEVSNNEMKVAQLHAMGYRAKEIASILNESYENNFRRKPICESTIYNKVLNVMRKCGLEKKNDLLILCAQEKPVAYQN